MSHASTARSYIIESQGRSYCHNLPTHMPTKSYHYKTITSKTTRLLYKYSYYKTITNKAPTRFPRKSYHYKAITSITSRTATRFPYKTKHFRTISHYGITSKHKTNHFKTTNVKTMYQHLDASSLQDHQNKTQGIQLQLLLQLTLIKY